LAKKPGKGQQSAAAVKQAAAAGKPKTPKSQQEARKQAAAAKALGRLQALQPATAVKQKISPRAMLIIGGGACALVALVFLIFYSPADKEAPTGAPPQAKAMTPGAVPEQAGAPLAGLSGEDRKDYPVIRTIRFEPLQPTRTDTLKAEVLAEAPDPGRLTYAYVWKVNDQVVEGAQGDTLDLSALELKKRDLITVSVTPYDGERAGFPVESPVVAVQSIPPTLDLKMTQQSRKASETLEMQLVSRHPDSDGVTFSLEDPTVPGMSIDPKSGKITWMVQPNQQGTIRFGAAVEDTEQTRVTRAFDITLEKYNVASAPAGTGPSPPPRP
jgi:hypothetical protein